MMTPCIASYPTPSSQNPNSLLLLTPVQKQPGQGVYDSQRVCRVPGQDGISTLAKAVQQAYVLGWQHSGLYVPDPCLGKTLV